MEDDNDNRIVQDEPDNAFEFKYNFINAPWDDRTTNNKVGIISLLLSIFVATMACVIHNLVTHYAKSTPSLSADIKCNLVKIDEYQYAARIHSMATQELLCLGAVVSPSSVIVNGICVMSGPIRLRFGTPTDPRCKKGFSVDFIEPIYHEGTLSKQLALLSSSENMADCVKVIKIGDTLDWQSKVYIIGRPLREGRLLSRQPAFLARTENFTTAMIKNLNLKSVICVMEPGKCPVRAGDLLVQDGRIFGVASTSTHATEQNKVVWFADIRIVAQELKQHDREIVLM